jgi:hypothetical protein
MVGYPQDLASVVFGASTRCAPLNSGTEREPGVEVSKWLDGTKVGIN